MTENGYVGAKFGYLKLMCIVNGGQLWACKCDCGEWAIVDFNKLKAGKRVSCGCAGNRTKKKSGPLTREEAAIRQLLVHYRNHQQEFLLTKEEFAQLLKSNCFYCDIEPKQELLIPAKGYGMHGSNDKIKFLYNGIDRKNNLVGYTTENCVACCKNCNRAKGAMSFDDFRNWASMFSSKTGLW